MENQAPDEPKYDFCLPKSHRLTGKKSIEELFKNGSSFYSHPLLLKYVSVAAPHSKVLFSVPKKKFKRAVDRNLIKRRLREVYRLNKHLLSHSTHYHLAFIYLDKEVLPYKRIEPKLIQLLRRLNRKDIKEE